jgi:K+-transporting ATPase ATPase C chain
MNLLDSDKENQMTIKDTSFESKSDPMTPKRGLVGSTPASDASNPKAVLSSAVSGGSIFGHIWASIGATIVLGVICCGLYPLAVYGLGQWLFPIQANGSLITKDGTPTTDDSIAVGSSLIGQSFSAPNYFHSRPSAAGNGYDATSSGGTNLGPLSDKLINGVTATAPAPAPTPSTAPSTQTATAAAATAPAATAAATAAATTPATVETLSFDGIRLRCIHYAVDNGIPFKLYTVKPDGTRIAEVPLSKYEDSSGNLNDVALVDAFPHPESDAPDKTPLIAADFGTLIPADAVTASGSGLDPHISPQNAQLQAARVAKARNLSLDQVKKLIDTYTDQPSLGVLGDPGVNVLRLNIALDKLAPPAAASASAPATTK